MHGKWRAHGERGRRGAAHEERDMDVIFIISDTMKLDLLFRFKKRPNEPITLGTAMQFVRVPLLHMMDPIPTVKEQCKHT